MFLSKARLTAGFLLLALPARFPGLTLRLELPNVGYLSVISTGPERR
jgi:hypothetical protein